jgi:hypothetical protein
MAETTALRNVVLPYAVYGLPYALTFPLLDADGDPVAPSSPDSEVSKNADTFADCTNEATEIAPAGSGICYLVLTGAEMAADTVTVRVQSAGAKTMVFSIPTRKLAKVRSGTSQSAGAATGTIVLDASASPVNDYYNGMIVAATIDGNVEVRTVTDYVGGTKTATVTPDWTVAPDADDTFDLYLPEGMHPDPMADVVLARGVQGVEAVADEFSLASIVLLLLQWDTTTTPGTLTVKRTDGTTVHLTRTLTSSPTAELTTGSS